MRTGYRVLTKPNKHSAYEDRDIHTTLEYAKASACALLGIPANVPWNTNGEGNHWPDLTPTEDDMRTCVVTEQIPESPEDRADLAVDLIVKYGSIDGAHHKAWVMDQVVRVLTGDRYEQVVEEYGNSGAGNLWREWDQGIAP